MPDSDAHELVASLLDLVARLDADGCFAAITGSPELLFGMRAEELVGRPLDQLLDPEHVRSFEVMRGRALRGEAAGPRELRFRHTQGHEVWLEIGLRKASDEALLLGARDVTIRRRGELALEESRERYRLLFERSPVGVMHYDAALRISDCNDSFRQIIGSSYEQLVGLDMKALRDPRVLPALRAALQGRQGEYEGPYEATTSRNKLWISMRTVPFHDQHGNVQGGICIVEDSTDRRYAEDIQQATYEISEAVHRTDDLDELYRSIHEVLARLMPAENIYFALYDKPTDTISFPYFVDRYDPPPPPRRASSGLSELVVHSGEPLLLATKDELEKMLTEGKNVPRGTLPESWLGVPLRRSNRETIGLLALQSYDPRVRFDERQREVLSFVAAQVTLAIERKRHQEQIERMAFFDGLTGLYNRRLLQERAQQSLDLAKRHEWSVAFLYLDLDRFKNVNDTLGHDAGDELLAEIASLLRGWLRASDTLARLGGDEFAFVLNDVDGRAAVDAADRILGLLDRPFQVRGQRVHVGASIGIALYPEHGTTIDELLKHADIAMYHAKVGGGAHAFYDPEHSPFSRERLTLEAELRQAISAGELELHYQPLRALADGALVGFEALARWQRHGVLVPAAEFIPLAEESELIRHLDWRILRQLLYEAREVLRQADAASPTGRRLHLAVNLSARSLHAPGLVDHLSILLQETAVDPSRIVLEVTESAAIRQAERSFATLAQLSRLGLRLAMDDFGTGFASLTYLRNMPLHRVKIDGTLIRQLGSDARGEELVRGAIGLGHGLGLEVVGEGVETQAQLDWLRAQRCDLAQGYLVGHPMPISELRKLIGAPAVAERSTGERE